MIDSCRPMEESSVSSLSGMAAGSNLLDWLVRKDRIEHFVLDASLCKENSLRKGQLNRHTRLLGLEQLSGDCFKTNSPVYRYIRNARRRNDGL